MGRGCEVEQRSGLFVDFEAARIARALVDPRRQAVLPKARELLFESRDFLRAGPEDALELAAVAAVERELAGAAHRTKAEAFEARGRHRQKRPVSVMATTWKLTSPGASSDSLTLVMLKFPSER